MKIAIIQNIIDIVRGKKLFNKPTIPFLVFWVGTKCTLKCKLCCNLIPYIAQESSNSDEILKDLEFICKNVHIQTLQIQGGEPFTHPNADKIIDFVGNLKNIDKVEIATNGTLQLKQNVIDALKKNPHITVRVSDYDCAKNLQDKIIKQLEENNINFYAYKFMYGNNTWFSTGGVNETREENDEKVKKTYDICDEKGCVTYYNGKILTCGKIPAIKLLYNCEQHESYDEVDVRQIRLAYSKPFFDNKDFKLRKSIKLFYKNYHQFKEQCRYCKITGEKHPAAQQLTQNELKEILCQKQ